VRKSGFALLFLVFLLVFSFGFLAYAESDEVEEWIAVLKDENPRIRETAVEILGKLREPWAIGPLVLACVDKAPEVREAALGALEAFPRWWKSDAAKSAVSALIKAELIEALKDEDSEVREFAAWVLGEIGDPKAVEPLIEALQDEDSTVRWRAANALGEIGDPKAVEPLITALKDENSGVRRSAAGALGKIGDPKAVEPLIEALKEDPEVRVAAAGALGWIGDPRAVKPLIEALKDKDPKVRGNSAQVLGEIGDPKAVEPLISALKDEDSSVRSYVAGALGKIKDPKAVESLITALKDESPGVRVAAAGALGKIKDPRAVEPLIEALKDEDSEVREFAAWALGEIKDPRAVEPLITALKDEDSSVRQGAAGALGEIKDPEALEPLIEALKDEDSGVRWYAAFALIRIDPGWREDSAVERVLSEVSSVLKDENSRVRRDAVLALSKIKDPEAIALLIEALKDENSDVRWYAAWALGEIGDPKALEPLIAALKDKDFWVREFAAWALEKITGEKLGRNFWKWREWFEKKTAASPTTSRVEFEGKGVPYVCGGGCWNGGRDRFGGLNEISIENGRPGKSVRIFPVRGTLPQKLRVVLEGRRWQPDLGDHIDYAALGLERGDNSWSKTPQTIIEGTLTPGGSLTQNGYTLTYEGGGFRISLAGDYSEAFKAVPWKGVVLRVYDEAGVEMGKYSFRETRIGSDPSSPLEAGGIFPRVESAFGQCVWWALWRKWEEEWKPDSSKVIKAGSLFYPPPGGKRIEKGWRPLPHDIIVLHIGPGNGHYAFVEGVDDEEYRSGAKPYIKLSISEFNLATDFGGYTQTYSASTVYWWPDGEEVRFTRNPQPPHRGYPWTKKTNEQWEWYYVGPERSPVGTGPARNPRVP